MTNTLQKNTNVSSRNASLDLLRVIAMLMIVMGHCFVHGRIEEAVVPGSLNYYITKIVPSFLNVHVNCYVLISGYFLCEGKFKFKKLVNLWLTTFFWSILLFLSISLAFNEFSIKELIFALFPITQARYWFITTYMLMYILFPFMNIAIHAMNKSQHLACIITFFVAYILIQNIVFWNEAYTRVGTNHVMLFMFLYFVAAYIRRFPPKAKTAKLCGAGYLLCCTLASVWKIAVSPIIKRFTGREVGSSAFWDNNSVIVVIASVCLFIAFLQMELKSKTIIKLSLMLSPLTYGVYLIHEQIQMLDLLWERLIKPYEFANELWLFPAFIVLTAVIFIVCCCLEKARMCLFKLLRVDKAVDKLMGFAEKKITTSDKLLKLKEKIIG